MTLNRISRAGVLALFIGVAALGACSSKKDETSPPITQRERDSLLGASSLPGAKGVKGALSVQDSATRRKAVLDSIAKADSL